MAENGSMKMAICSVVGCLFFICQNASGSGKVGVYAIRMVPYGQDAEMYTQPSWGGGLHAVFPLPFVSRVFAVTGGLDIVDLLSKELNLRDRLTGLRVVQTTTQTYVRFYAGGQFGGHGDGFLRPHAGLNLALTLYDFRIDDVVPNDADPDNPLSQNLIEETRVVFGYDITLGLDLNFSNTIALDGGVKYVKSFSVPQQLGPDAAKIYPQYFQIYMGIGISFDLFGKKETEPQE